jgi:uncharacterized protein YegL
MADSVGTGFQTKIDAAKEAAMNFLQAAQIGSNTNIEVGVISFSDTVQVVSPLTSNYNTLVNSINSLYAEGATSVGDAIQVAVNSIEQNKQPDVTYVIVLMTDGMSNSDVVASPQAAASYASQNGVTVDSVAFGADADVYTCQQIANIGNGQYFYAANGNDLVSSFKGIASSLVSPAMHYGSRVMMLIAIPLVLFLPEIEKGTMIVAKSISTTVLKRPPTIEGIKCPKCNHFNRPDAKFCGGCSAPLLSAATRCPRCGHTRRAGARFCGSCGYTFNGAE